MTFGPGVKNVYFGKFYGMKWDSSASYLLQNYQKVYNHVLTESLILILNLVALNFFHRQD